jgi:hypothetical protein
MQSPESLNYELGLLNHFWLPREFNPVIAGNRDVRIDEYLIPSNSTFLIKNGPGGIRTPDIRVRSPALCPS